MRRPLVLQQKLNDRETKGNLRHLRADPGLIDFYSNDYLGLARSPVFRQRLEQELLLYQDHFIGATGSRLLSGTTELTLSVESQLATFHRSEAALLFSSGYAANTGFFSAVPQRGDTIFYDESIHASVKDGVRLSFAKAYPFRHNSPEDLQRKFHLASGHVYVAVESLYSMDGDLAPLPELTALCREEGAYLVMDEAHSNGIYGLDGAGMVVDMGLTEQVFARIVTFGKALGSHGAAILGDAVLTQFLVNFSRPFIYSTALPLPSVLAIKCAYDLLPALNQERANLHALSDYLKNALNRTKLKHSGGSSPIQAVFAEDRVKLKKAAYTLEQQGIAVRPVFSPTVPEGKERLRMILHAFNHPQEIEVLTQILADTL